jgi:hypothetical protein
MYIRQYVVRSVLRCHQGEHPPLQLIKCSRSETNILRSYLLFRRFTAQIPVLPCPGSTSNTSSERCPMKPFNASEFRSSGAWEAAQLRYDAPPMTPSHALSVSVSVSASASTWISEREERSYNGFHIVTWKLGEARGERERERERERGSSPRSHVSMLPCPMLPCSLPCSLPCHCIFPPKVKKSPDDKPLSKIH